MYIKNRMHAAFEKYTRCKWPYAMGVNVCSRGEVGAKWELMGSVGQRRVHERANTTLAAGGWRLAAA